MNARLLVALPLLLALGCRGPAPLPDAVAEVTDPAAGTSDAGVCEVNPCFLCPPPSGLCRTVGCVAPDEDGNVCEDIQRAPGQWCASGWGTCDVGGNCVVPGGACQAPPLAWRRGCVQSVDCDDGDACTVDTCLNSLGDGWCDHVPVLNGTRCAPGSACKSGLCCVI